MFKNKRFMIGLAFLLALAVAIPAIAQGATTPSDPNTNSQSTVTIAPEKAKEINALHQKMLDLKSQMIDKYLEAGLITSDQAKAAKDRLEQCKQNIEKNPNVVPRFFGGGKGFWGHGRGFCGQGRGTSGGATQSGFCGNCPGCPYGSLSNNSSVTSS
ncbi:MAG: YckD family protein [Bacillota bacterium]